MRCIPTWGIAAAAPASMGPWCPRSEEHTSELQSQSNLVCRLLLEKKKKVIETPWTRYTQNFTSLCASALPVPFALVLHTLRFVSIAIPLTMSLPMCFAIAHDALVF